MNYYYITGTSRGLGRALAIHLLEATPDNMVTGISRTSTISHKNYAHITADLSDQDQIGRVRFKVHSGARQISLVNNAGMIGIIKPCGKLEPADVTRLYNTNLLAPTLLTNNFMETYRNEDAGKLIICVSSGAGQNPVGGWGPYCASKAALDMFCRVVAEEEKGGAKHPFRIMSVAPGIVDTEMQAEIRNARAEDFSRLSHFVNYKADNQLSTPEMTARKYAFILRYPDKFHDVVFSVKDIPAPS